MSVQRRWASSAQVYRCSWMPGRWNWTASGPSGMTMGSAATEEEAWSRARAAQQSLKHPMYPRGIG